MSEAVLITMITVFGGGLVGVWVELVRARRAVTPNSGNSMRDVVDRIETTQRKHGERLARVETSIKHLAESRAA